MSDRGNEFVVAPVFAEAERSVDRNATAMRAFETWTGKMSGRLRDISELVNKTHRGDELFQDETTDKLVRWSAQFQLDYPTMILSMPDINRNRADMKRALRMAISPGTMGPLLSTAESYLKGAVSTVTFVDLLHSLGPEFHRITIDELKVDWRTDAYGSTDLAVSLGDKVYAFSLKTVGGAVPAEGMVQRVKGVEPVLFGNKVVDVKEQRKMIGQVREWREEMDALGDHREIVPLVVFVPSDPEIVDKYLGFLNDDPRDTQKAREKVAQWRGVFRKRMRDLGVEIPPDEVEGSSKISSNGNRNE